MISVDYAKRNTLVIFITSARRASLISSGLRPKLLSLTARQYNQHRSILTRRVACIATPVLSWPGIRERLQMTTDNDLLAAAGAIKAEIVNDRRLIHRYPELAYNEHKTAALVASRLRGLGIEVKEGVGGTGVVGLLQRRQRGQDGAPAGGHGRAADRRSRTTSPFASTNAGAMHACGHDVHTTRCSPERRAAALSAARDTWRGTLMMIGQPARRAAPGAVRMLRDGAAGRASHGRTAAFALHVDPALERRQSGRPRAGLTHSPAPTSWTSRCKRHGRARRRGPT